MKTFLRYAFPIIMLTITIATAIRYGSIQDFRKRSTEHQITIEASDIRSLERALRSATFQEVGLERISENRYRIVIRCPPDDMGSIFGLLQRLGVKRSED